MFQASMTPVEGLGSDGSFDSLVEQELSQPLREIVKGMVGESFDEGDQPQPLKYGKEQLKTQVVTRNSLEEFSKLL